MPLSSLSCIILVVFDDKLDKRRNDDSHANVTMRTVDDVRVASFST